MPSAVARSTAPRPTTWSTHSDFPAFAAGRLAPCPLVPCVMGSKIGANVVRCYPRPVTFSEQSTVGVGLIRVMHLHRDPRRAGPGDHVVGPVRLPRHPERDTQVAAAVGHPLIPSRTRRRTEVRPVIPSRTRPMVTVTAARLPPFPSADRVTLGPAA